MKAIKIIGITCLVLITLSVLFGGVTFVKAVQNIDNNDAFVQTIQASAAGFVEVLSANGNALEKTLTANGSGFTIYLNHLWKMIDKIWTP